MGTTKAQIKDLRLVMTSGKSAEYYTPFNILVKLIILAITISLIDLNVVQCEESQIQYKFMPVAAKNENQMNKISCPSEPTIEFGNNDHDGVNTDMLPKFNMLVEDEAGNLSRVKHLGFISMSCKGSQPVTWQFQGLTNLSEIIKSVEITRSSSDTRDSSTFCYTARINFTIPRPFAGLGLYTCSYLGNVKNKKSLYFYGNDNLPNLLAKLDGADHIQVESFSTDEVILPCLGNWPNMTVQLTRQNSDGDFQPLDNSTVNIIYDAKHGFTITKKDVNDLETNLDGTYKCQTQDARGLKNDIVTLTTKFAGAKPERSNKMEITIQEYNNNCSQFVCWSKSHQNNRNETDANKLQMFVIKCNNPIQCQLALGFLERGADFVQHYESEPDTCGQLSDISREIQISSIKVNSEHTAGVVICRTSDKKKFQYSQFFRSVRHSDSDRKTVLLDSNNDFSDDLKTNTRAQILQPIDPASVIFMDPKELSPRMFVNEQSEILCDIANFVFANGSKLLVKYSNGSVSAPQILKNKQNFKNQGLTVEMDTTVKITSKDIVAFVCLAPLWNSDKWINITFPVNVSEGVLPQLTRSSSDLHLSLYDTDVNQTLICEATGTPLPNLEWYKNGEPFEDNSNNSESIKKYTHNTNIIELHFKNVSYNKMNIQGIYVCNATNFKGTQLYNFTVEVKSFSAMEYAYPPFTILLLLSMIILGFCLIKFWKKSDKQRKFIQQLTKDQIEQFEYGRHASVCAGSDLSDYANVSGGVKQALYQPYNKERYEISPENLIIDRDDKLGEGHYGIVLKGKMISPRSTEVVDVAVKTLKEWDVGAAEMLLSELKILSHIDKHDNVVSLLGAVTNYRKYEIQLVLELCSEGSLENFLRVKKESFLNEIGNDDEVHYSQPICNNNVKSNYVQVNFSVRTFDLIRWAHQLARGMEYIASLKIIHGDLAARNLLLTDTRQLKITDFGLSKKLKNYQRNYIPSISSTEREQPWRSLAPECLNANNQLSFESDVWAYGVTLWEIFSLGVEPYPEYPTYTPHYVNSLLSGYRMKKPEYSTSKIYIVMLNCWKKEPQNRPSFSMLVAEFEKLLPTNYISFIRGSNGNFEVQKRSQPLSAAATKAVSTAYITPDQLEQFEILE